MKTPEILAFVGPKGSGKSELIARLIAQRTREGYRVGVIKYMAKPNLEIDEPGKDTYDYRMRGAGTVILSGMKRLAIFSNQKKETPLEELLKHFQDYDLILLDGFADTPYPTFEVENSVPVPLVPGTELKSS